jgi:hypothetical protein
VEHLGDVVAGRYVLVAPSCPRAARRQYHAVDILLDRTVAVRFEPRDAVEQAGMARLRTVDGCRVLAGGTFEGSCYVVISAAEVTSVSVAELEAMLATPCAPEPGSPGGTLSAAARRLAVAAEVFAALAVVVFLLVATVLVTGGAHATP